MKKFVLAHYRWGCLTNLLIIGIIFLTSITFAQTESAQDRTDDAVKRVRERIAANDSAKSDSTIVKKEDLIKQFEAEIIKLQKSLEDVYMQIATTDPQTVQRMTQLLDANPRAVALMTAINLYQKEIDNLKKKPSVVKKE